jgi:hypothetical protein
VPDSREGEVQFQRWQWEESGRRDWAGSSERPEGEGTGAELTEMATQA